mgnify:CR=1 FL=1
MRMSLSLGKKKNAVREDLDMRLALSCSFFNELPRTGTPIPNERLDFEQFLKKYGPGQKIASAKLKRNCPCSRITHRGKDSTSYVALICWTIQLQFCLFFQRLSSACFLKPCLQNEHGLDTLTHYTPFALTTLRLLFLCQPSVSSSYPLISPFSFCPSYFSFSYFHHLIRSFFLNPFLQH